MKFGNDFSWLWVAIIRIFTAPFYIVLWCINVVKSAVGMFLFWIIGKICLTLVLIALLGCVHYFFKESSEKFLSAILGWYYSNVMGWSPEPWMTDGQIFEAPKGAVSFFPYPNIEVPIMIVLTLLVATVRTIYREEFDEL